jgi:hypothetical protein
MSSKIRAKAQLGNFILDISRKEKRPLSKPLPETERGLISPLP